MCENGEGQAVCGTVYAIPIRIICISSEWLCMVLYSDYLDLDLGHCVHLMRVVVEVPHLRSLDVSMCPRLTVECACCCNVLVSRR